MKKYDRLFSYDFERLVERYAANTAILKKDSDYSLTYQGLDQKISQVLTYLKTKGLKPGDSLVSILPNSPEKIIIFLATIKGGYGFAPLTCDATIKEVERWKKLINPKLIFTCSLTKDDILDHLKTDSTQFKIDVDQQFSWLTNKAEETTLGNAPRLYLSTSGTTGEPKAIVIDSNKLWASGCAFVDYHHLQDTQARFWNYLPMSYLGGLFNLSMIPLATGGSFVIDEAFTGKTFLGFWQTIERYDINSVWMVPTIARGLLALALRTKRNEMKNYSSIIKTCFIGTAPIDLDTKKKFEETFGITLLENFALSETTFLTSENKTNIASRFEGSTGETLPYVEIKLERSPEDEATEIKVKTPFLFLGYMNEKGQIENTLDKDGFFPTGDFGVMKNNQLQVTGRKRDIIKKGGHFIALREIEAVVNQCQGVAETAAVKINHDFYGEAYNLYVVMSDNAAIDNVNKFIHENIVKYKWPEKILPISALPKTASGKIQKHLIKG